MAVAVFFSVAEAVFATLGQARAAKAFEEGQQRFAELAERPERVHYAVVLGKYGALLAATMLFGAALDRIDAIAWGIPAFILFVILFVEMGPRSMALYRGRSLAGPLL